MTCAIMSRRALFKRPPSPTSSSRSCPNNWCDNQRKVKPFLQQSACSIPKFIINITFTTKLSSGAWRVKRCFLKQLTETTTGPSFYQQFLFHSTRETHYFDQPLQAHTRPLTFFPVCKNTVTSFDLSALSRLLSLFYWVVHTLRQTLSVQFSSLSGKPSKSKSSAQKMPFPA